MYQTYSNHLCIALNSKTIYSFNSCTTFLYAHVLPLVYKAYQTYSNHIQFQFVYQIPSQLSCINFSYIKLLIYIHNRNNHGRWCSIHHKLHKLLNIKFVLSFTITHKSYTHRLEQQIFFFFLKISKVFFSSSKVSFL